MSRIKLSSQKALTFYQDELTAARRTSPIPQLTCSGKPCKVYKPEVVRCQNIGGSGTDVDWKCEADLPEALRFGKVQVSCEGWTGPGDPYVLKDSCSLEYRLVEVPRDLRNDQNSNNILRPKQIDISSLIFSVIWISVLLFICYSFLKSCLQNRNRDPPAGNPRSNYNRPGGGPGPSNWFPGGHDDYSTGPGDAPPPYSKNAPTGGTGQQGWRPGFWTGAVAGLAADRFLFRNNNDRREASPRARQQWDWEQSRRPTPPSFFGAGSSRRGWASSSDDRGEGSSDLGSMRRSTGFGSSNVR